MAQKAKTLGFIGAVVGALVLAGCAEKEEILPGERMNVRDILQSQAGLDETLAETGSQAVSLPGAQSNGFWSQSMVSPHARVSHAALSPSLTQVWATDIGAGDSRRQRLNVDPVLADGRVFAMDSEHVVSAVSTAGQVLWSRDLTPLRDKNIEGQGGGLAYSDGKLFAASGFGTLSALDAATGKELWVQRLGGTATGAPTIRDGVLYIVSADQVGWAIEAESGRIRWQIEGTGDINNVAGAPAPAVSDKHVVFAFGAATVQTAFRQGGLRLWNADILGRRNGVAISGVDDLTGDPVISGDTVYAGNHSGRIVAFSLHDGERLWTTRQGALGPAWPAGGSLFFVSDRNQLIRLDAANGEQIWATDLPGWVPRNKPNRKRDSSYANHGPILAGGRLIVAGSDGQLRSFSPVDGSLVSSVEIKGGATTRPIVAGNTLYVVSGDGVLHAFK
ncbi:PQQ-like beta-propeller repeat protein [uncultured Pelagimonas sp.]|uniref:PQQ-like beta-propeller repeat protein n=1 Tax=uncultured Pelagimonas sp. TaxID=1618102 RepID=UPI00261F9224|nr:PQQ-like beta-propeller repeat protein [uncultured Pelagimonas sp.]